MHYVKRNLFLSISILTGNDVEHQSKKKLRYRTYLAGDVNRRLNTVSVHSETTKHITKFIINYHYIHFNSHFPAEPELAGPPQFPSFTDC